MYVVTKQNKLISPMTKPQDQRASLLTQHATSSAGYKPLILESCYDMDTSLLSALLHDSHAMVFDTLVTQLDELLKSRHPQQRWSRLALDPAIQAHIRSNEQIDYGVWAYYPWSRRLV